MITKTWQLQDQVRQINEYLQSKGYDKRIKMYPNRDQTRFQLTLFDVSGNYDLIEYGNYTRDKTNVFLTAMYIGLGLGSLDFIVSG